MNRTLTILAVLILTCTLLACTAKKEETTATPPATKQLTTDEERLSYAFGLEVGDSLKNLPTAIKVEFFTQAVSDSLTGGVLLMTQEEAVETRQAFIQGLQAKQQQEMMELAKKNSEQGAAFLQENSGKEGVTTTASGLQYLVLEKGDGPLPTATDIVKVHYQGTLIDGTEFDNSYTRGEPVTLPVTEVIDGWTEALQLMPVGSKYRLFIPSNLAYGDRGAGPVISPNSTLIFEVELLGIETEADEEHEAAAAE